MFGTKLNQSWETCAGSGGTGAGSGGTTIIKFKAYGINPPNEPYIGDVWVSPNGVYIFDGNTWLLTGNIENKENNVNSILEKRCEYCGTKILNNLQTHCKSCGAPL